MKLSPKIKRNISRILPFGFIWFVLGLVFLLNDITISYDLNDISEASIELTLPVLVFALSAIFVLGLIIGTIEMVFFEKRFTTYSFTGKIFAKFLIYVLFLFIIILITYPIAASIDQGLPPFHPEVLKKLVTFLSSVVFLNTALQLSFELFVSLIYAAISENLGHNVLKNFFTGKYHTPKKEKRIFMFLDMKQSTTIAENLGHVTYFKFLRSYYDLMSDAIINHYAEVYQYVGDEIVLTWEMDKGISNNNWLNCYWDLKKAISKEKNRFFEVYKFNPDFRAGVHMGEVTAGEIGSLKKEIVFTGDVLNTAARLQAMGKELSTDLVFSSNMEEHLRFTNNHLIKELGKITLKGKTTPTTLYTLEGPRESTNPPI